MLTDYDIDEVSFDDMDFSYCPECAIENTPIGMLGKRKHYSCRFCGMWWSETDKEGN